MKPAVLILILSVFLNGCISLKAGTWHQNAENETTYREVGFDTAQLLPSKQNDPSLTMGDNV